MEQEQMYQVLMTMTELEAAALAMLDALDRGRETLRAAMEGGQNST